MQTMDNAAADDNAAMQRMDNNADYDTMMQTMMLQSRQ
jgi:hypothetical protein